MAGKSTKTLQERFDEKVDKSGTCWIWKGAYTRGGYGHMLTRLKPHGGNVMTRAHRVSFYLANGYLNDAMHVLHSCDNPTCVNPKHLREGTEKDNTKDKLERGRHGYGVKSGHKRLSFEIATQIRAVYSTGEFTMRDVANMFDTSPPQVCRVINNQTWVK